MLCANCAAREGKSSSSKGARCYTDKCAVTRRAYAPGQHGQGRKKTSEYGGLQLRAKQMTRRYYGVLESQFHKYYEMATKKPGKTGDELLFILESRLDNVVYRLGWASSRAEARQLVVHGHFTVNGRRVDIPSYLTKEGRRTRDPGKTAVPRRSSKRCWKRTPPARCRSGWKSTVTPAWEKSSQPLCEDVDLDVEETLIVELYSSNACA